MTQSSRAVPETGVVDSGVASASFRPEPIDVPTWRKAMEGVPSGPWQMKDFDTELSISTMAGAAPLIADIIEQGDSQEPGLWGSEYQIGQWLARCSPAGISTLLDALEAKDRDLAEADAEIVSNHCLIAEERQMRFAAERQRDEAMAALREKEERVAEMVRVVRLYCEHDNLTDRLKLGALLNHPYFARESGQPASREQRGSDAALVSGSREDGE